ncbi:TPA: hypothetical protein G9F27_005803 [Salmonella enterica]|uniref:Uncharacterized protein n=1 Tax=Salmonella enterica TaxID=28901 RepID=A0A743SQB7_SALER|nr:hypothetical protein [Salmonella enterica]
MKYKTSLPAPLIVTYDNLFYNYHKDKLILLRAAYKQALEIYECGHLKQAQLSFLFILMECKTFLVSVEPLSAFYNKTALLIIDVKKSASECEKLLREIACL